MFEQLTPFESKVGGTLGCAEPNDKEYKWGKKIIEHKRDSIDYKFEKTQAREKNRVTNPRIEIWQEETK